LGERLVAHGRLLYLGGGGICSRAVASAAAESAAGTEPVGVVLFHRPAPPAPHPRVAAGAKRRTTVSGAIPAGAGTGQPPMRFAPHEARALCGVKKEAEPWISIRSCCRACSSLG